MARVPTIQPFQERTGVAPQADFSPIARTAGDFGESAGRQLQQAGNELGQIALEEQGRLDDIALREADTALVTARTTLLNDPENGFFAQRGKNAVEGFDPSLESYDEEARRIRDSLRPHLHDKWGQIVSTRRSAAFDAMSGHVLRERERFEDDTTQARLDAALNDAVANWTDPGLRRQAMISAADEFEALAERKGWSSDVRAAKEAEFRSSVHAGTFDQIVGDDLRAAQAYLEANRDEMAASVIVSAEKAIDREQRRLVAEARRAQALAQAQTTAALSVAILEGDATQEDIDAAYQSGQITPAAWASLRGREATVSERRAREAEAFEIVAAGGPLDPNDDAHRDAVDSAFKASGGIDGLVGRNPNTATQVAQLAESTGIVPPTAQRFIRGALASGDDAHRQYAYDLIARIDETDPRALDRAFSGTELAEATQYIKLTRAGVSDAQAMTSIEESRTLDQTTRDVRRAEGAKAFADLDVEDAFFDPSAFPFDQGKLPEFRPLADKIVDDAQTLFVDAFVRTGDEEVATTITRRALAKTYGQTDVAGAGSIVQYPPEAFYSVPGVDSGWMREQLVRDVSERVSGRVADVSADRIELVPTPRTAADVRAGRPPRYQVLVMDDNGIYEPVMEEDGTVLDYTFDSEEPRRARQLELEAEREAFLENQRLAPHTLIRDAVTSVAERVGLLDGEAQ